MPHHDQADPKNLAKLCRIQLTEEEERALSSNLERILGYMDLLDEVDTEGVPPCTHVLETIQNVMREDEVKEGADPSAILAGAPDKVGGMFKVPIIAKEES